jgi:1,3-beta-glucan synthase
MNAFGQGSRIKHTEYYQPPSLSRQNLNRAMGEQMLSRKYHYLGTQLPIDQLLMFYYGHPGFMINNMLVILAVQVFVLTSTSISPTSGFNVPDP